MMMRKIILGMSLLLSSLGVLKAQTADNKWSLGIFGNMTEYNGDIENRFFTFKDVRENAGVGLQINYFLSPFLDLNTHFSYGNMAGGKDTLRFFKAEMLTSDIGLRYKLYNGKILKKDALIGPYIDLGTGLTYADTRGIGSYLGAFSDNRHLDLNFNVGVGARIRLANQIYGFVQTRFHYYLNDKYDGAGFPWDSDLRNKVNDAYLEHAVGFIFEIGNAKDTDGDGVADSKDLCADTPTGVVVDATGCPVDTDGDGVADYLDACPNLSGTVAFKGCPDTDGDGIEDSKDTCPKVAGLAKFDGCADTDGDGIADPKDECPSVAGLAKFNGCADSDNDGVEDRKDKCPNTRKGFNVDVNGCDLDTDSDGVVDGLDRCPSIAGLKANKGCPEIKQEVKDKLTYAAKNVRFETGSTKLTPSSLKIMEDIAQILRDYPAYSLTMDGYTDSRGNKAKNLQLSKDRAASCKAKLVSLGIAETRLTDEGYGIDKPIATNNTARGRALNRRVEFNLVLPD